MIFTILYYLTLIAFIAWCIFSIYSQYKQNKLLEKCNRKLDEENKD